MNGSRSTDHLQKELAAIASSFERTTHPKWNELMPFKDSIAAFRKKKASFKTIATILRGKSISVSHDTIARFCWHVLGEGRTKRKRQPEASSVQTNGSQAANRRHTKVRAPLPTTSVQSSLDSGPRIARVEDL